MTPFHLTSHCAAPVVLVHGGAGKTCPSPERREKIHTELSHILRESHSLLARGESALTVATFAVRLLEETPLFNAGRGAVLQSDGAARLSASVMDGEKQTFSSVALATELWHPSQLALELQNRSGRNLGAPGTDLLMRELGVVPRTPVTVEQATRWISQLEKQDLTVPTGTVGAVVIDHCSRLAAATSTGGHGTDYPGRMSDVSTVAGCYASPFGAISCTGHGEQIIDAAVAARMECRLRDGVAMELAAKRALDEAVQQGHQYGWIALDRDGRVSIVHTTPHMAWGLLDSATTVPQLGALT